MTATTTRLPAPAPARVDLAPRPNHALRRLAAGAAAGFVVLEVVAFRWGHELSKTRPIRLDAAPLSGQFAAGLHGVLQRWNGNAVAALALGLVAAVVLPHLATRLRWASLLALSAAVELVWIVLVNANDGVDGLTRGVAAPNSYFHVVPRVGSAATFLSRFVGEVKQVHYGVHIEGHPPGMVLVFWALDRIGLGGLRNATALVILGGVLAGIAVLVAVRDVAGEAVARRAAPFVAVGPAAIWLGSAPDAFFAGIAAWAVACVVLATSRHGRSWWWWAAAGGVLTGVALMLSYGLALLVVPIAAVCAVRRRFGVVAVASAGAVAVLLGARLLGFSWLAGLDATRVRYWAGVASHRPGGYFTLADVAALLLALGPAIAVALVWLRGRSQWLLVGSGVAMAALADVSQMSRAETERIWLPFAVWMLAAGSALWVGRRPARTAAAFLVLQVVATMAVQTSVHTLW